MAQPCFSFGVIRHPQGSKQHPWPDFFQDFTPGLCPNSKQRPKLGFSLIKRNRQVPRLVVISQPQKPERCMLSAVFLLAMCVTCQSICWLYSNVIFSSFRIIEVCSPSYEAFWILVYSRSVSCALGSFLDQVFEAVFPCSTCDLTATVHRHWCVSNAMFTAHVLFRAFSLWFFFFFMWGQGGTVSNKSLSLSPQFGVVNLYYRSSRLGWLLCGRWALQRTHDFLL